MMQAAPSIARIALVLTVAIAAMGNIQVARAAGVVGNGTPESCTETALRAAMADGGTVTFDCGEAPHTITLDNVITLGEASEIDGGGLITISGGGSTRVFDVEATDVEATFRNLSISDGFSGDSDGGGIQSNGRLTIENVIFSGNRSDDDGGALEIRGTAAISGSQFIDNHAGNQGGAIEIHNSVVTMADSAFSGNTADEDGGAIRVIDAESVTVERSTFDGNQAGVDGGAIEVSSGTLNVIGSTFSQNQAGTDGGAIQNIRGSVAVTSTTFSANGAGVDGGAFHNQATASIAESTFFGNSAGVGGIIENTSVMTLGKSIISNSPSGQNCEPFNLPASAGHNLSDDESCQFTEIGDLQNTDPLLEPLADNGGPTQTHAINENSPAVDAGSTTCAEQDQRGIERPQRAACDIGSFELVQDSPETGGLLDNAVEPVDPAQGCVYHEATSHNLCGLFQDFWQANGGLAIFGYALTEEFVDAETGLTSQYFERARFEHHPSNIGTPYEVLLTRLGAADTEREHSDRIAPVEPESGCEFFDATGHNVCGEFMSYWNAYGGLPIYGYPLTESFVDPETGRSVQYFERARFELHPDAWPERFNVLLGLVGSEALDRELER